MNYKKLNEMNTTEIDKYSRELGREIDDLARLLINIKNHRETCLVQIDRLEARIKKLEGVKQ